MMHMEWKTFYLFNVMSTFETSCLVCNPVSPRNGEDRRLFLKSRIEKNNNNMPNFMYLPTLIRPVSNI